MRAGAAARGARFLPHRSIAVLLGLVLVALPPNNAAAQQDAVERLHRFLAETRTLRADFRQELFDEDLHLLEEAHGTVTLARPGRFRWTYVHPYEQHVVGDGERVWVYDADLAQVTVSDLDPGIGATPAVLLHTDRPIEESFAVKALGEEGDLGWVELLPRTLEPAFTHIRLALDSGGLRVMELRDGFGQLTRIVFDVVEVNPRFDDDHFLFIPPAGVDVVRR